MEEYLSKDELNHYDDSNDQAGREELFSKIVRAGKRTYFFDVKSTRRGDYYLTLTESKKRMGKDGKFHYEKHKIFLYREDFEKFYEGLNETVQFIQTNQPDFIDYSKIQNSNNDTDDSDY